MSDLIPRSWAWATLADLLGKLQYGYTAKASPDVEGARFLRITDLDKGEVHWAQVPGCAISSADLDRYRLHDGDIVFARTGSIEKTARVKRPPEAVFASYLIRGSPIDASLGPWLEAFSSSFLYVNQAKAASGGIGRSNINARSLGRIRLPVPSHSEQERIVATLESYFTRLNDTALMLDRVQRSMTRYRASVLKAAVEGRLVPTEAELARVENRAYEPASVLLGRILAERRRRWEAAELARMEASGAVPTNDRWKARYCEPPEPSLARLPELPEGWCWTTADAVGDVLLGRQRAPQYLTGRNSHPYLRVANIKDDVIDFSDVDRMDFGPEHFERYRLHPGDILVSEGQSPELLGQSAIYRGGITDLCFQKTLHRFRPIEPGPSSELAQLVFRSHVKTGLFKRLGSITTNIAHLTLVKFRASPFPLAPKQEQKRIVAEAERLLSIADQLETILRQEIARGSRLRQAILKWAFEGKLVDQDPNDEPAPLLLERIRAARRGADSGTMTEPPRRRQIKRGRP